MSLFRTTSTLWRHVHFSRQLFAYGALSPSRSGFLKQFYLGRKPNADALVVWFKNFIDYYVVFFDWQAYFRSGAM